MLGWGHGPLGICKDSKGGTKVPSKIMCSEENTDSMIMIHWRRKQQLLQTPNSRQFAI